MPSPLRSTASGVRTAAFLLTAALFASGCGSNGTPVPSTKASTTPKPPPTTHPSHPTISVLRAAQSSSLPAARSGIAATATGNGVAVLGGLDAATVSTTSVFRIANTGAVTTTATLPTPVHDAAAAVVSGRLLLFGGGPSEGSNRIVEVAPGPPHLIGTLPQALSDLVAVSIGGTAYVLGGWNGSAPNREIYAVRPGGTVSTLGHLPVGLRYPAAAALGGRVIVAGGETASGTSTRAAWSLDPVTGQLARLPDLPFPTDHAAAAALGGRSYLIGGLRAGRLTDAILSWAPGESSWANAGRLPAAISDLAAVPFAGGIEVIGGRGSAGAVATVTLMRAR